jgi:hypothetical protein
VIREFLKTVPIGANYRKKIETIEVIGLKRPKTKDVNKSRNASKNKQRLKEMIKWIWKTYAITKNVTSHEEQTGRLMPLSWGAGSFPSVLMNAPLSIMQKRRRTWGFSMRNDTLILKIIFHENAELEFWSLE